jgi:hypothetical protein
MDLFNSQEAAQYIPIPKKESILLSEKLGDIIPRSNPFDKLKI